MRPEKSTKGTKKFTMKIVSFVGKGAALMILYPHSFLNQFLSLELQTKHVLFNLSNILEISFLTDDWKKKKSVDARH